MNDFLLIVIIVLALNIPLSYLKGKHNEDVKIRTFLMQNKFRDHLYQEYKDWQNEEDK